MGGVEVVTARRRNKSRTQALMDRLRKELGDQVRQEMKLCENAVTEIWKVTSEGIEKIG